MDCRERRKTLGKSTGSWVVLYRLIYRLTIYHLYHSKRVMDQNGPKGLSAWWCTGEAFLRRAK